MKHVSSAVAYERRRGLGVLRNCAPALIAVVTIALSGCSAKETCDFPEQPYTTARSIPPLQVPSGMDEPNRAGSLSIPAEGKPKPRSKACLERPPSFFNTAKAAPVEVDPEQVVTNWAQTWADRDADGFLALYSASFQGGAAADTASAPEASTEDWREQRRGQIISGPIPDSKLVDVKIESPSPERRVVTFVQRFGANSFQKQLTLIRENGEWRIVAERVLGSTPE